MNKPKCYVLDYDNKINRYKELLHSFNNISFNSLNSHQINNILTEKQNLKNYLKSINAYLDDILSSPEISDEEIYNIQQDHREILSKLDDINSEINNLENSINHSDKTKKYTLEKPNNNSDDTKSNIIINITSGDKKTSIYPELRK